MKRVLYITGLFILAAFSKGNTYKVVSKSIGHKYIVYTIRQNNDSCYFITDTSTRNNYPLYSMLNDNQINKGKIIK